MRINLGCGQSPTPGWVNVDNSLTVKLARSPLSFLLASKRAYMERVRKFGIRHGDAGRLPFADGSAEVLYSSHMLEHLDQREAAVFLAEARRVLHPGGILRIVVPDLAAQIARYQATGDADDYFGSLNVESVKPRGVVGRLKYAFFTGFREHHWMYDGRSLSKLLVENGFRDPRVLAPGETSIIAPGELNLREREEESLYVEAFR